MGAYWLTFLQAQSLTSADHAIVLSSDFSGSMSFNTVYFKTAIYNDASMFAANTPTIVFLHQCWCLVISDDFFDYVFHCLTHKQA